MGGRENGEGAGEADCNCGDTKTSVKHTQKCIETQIAMKSKIKQESATKRERLSLTVSLSLSHSLNENVNKMCNNNSRTAATNAK